MNQNPPPLLSPDEEPFLIFANRYYLRKLNLDGSNYTLLKQVQASPPLIHLLGPLQLLLFDYLIVTPF